MCQPHRFFFQSPCALAGRLYPIPALAQRIFRLAFVRLGGSAAARGSLHGAAVDAQFRRIGGVAHLLLGGEDDFRGGEGVLHVAFGQRGLTHDALDEHLVREILLCLGLGEIHRLPLARAYRLHFRFDVKWYLWLIINDIRKCRYKNNR